MALCLLVILPVFFYALFLQDLLMHVLQAQEAALSTPWDYTVQDYAREPENGEAFAGFGQTQGLARQTYCDHESGIDSLHEQKPECQDDLSHHKELVAHVCWLHKDAQQVRCTVGGEGSGVGAFGVPLHQAYMNEFGRGGLIRCSARAGVQNYLLRPDLFSEFSRVKLSRAKVDGNTHENAEEGKWEDDAHGLAGNVYMLPWEQLAIVTDTWALTEAADVRPGTSGGDLHTRMASLYQHDENPGFAQMSSAAVEFVSGAIGDRVLAPGLRLGANAKAGPAGDDPRQPSLAIKPHAEGADSPSEEVTQQGSRVGYFNSEWRDWEQDNNQRTYEARGNWYMGCARAEGC